MKLTIVLLIILIVALTTKVVLKKIKECAVFFRKAEIETDPFKRQSHNDDYIKTISIILFLSSLDLFSIICLVFIYCKWF
jgi:hypothetical protein